MNLRERLEQLLRARGVNQKDIALATGISAAAINNYFKKGDMPKSDQLAQLAKYFGVSMDYLFHGRESEIAPMVLKDAPARIDAEIAEAEESLEEIKHRVARLENVLSKMKRRK